MTLKKIKKIYQIIFPFIVIIFSAFLFSYSIRAFVNKSGLLTSGLSGVSLVIARLMGMVHYDISLKQLLDDPQAMFFVNTWTSIIFFIGNIPLIILAIRKLGIRFTLISATFIIFNSLFISILPESIMNIFIIENDSGLANAVFGGATMGIAIALALKVGGSTGGVEILATYFSRKRQISIGKVSSTMNAAVIIIGGIILQAWPAILFTLVLVFVNGRVVDALHRATNKKVIQVVCEQYLPITNVISSQTKYNSTVTEVLGGYSNVTKYMVTIVVPEEMVDYIIQLVADQDQKTFIYTYNISSILGNFYIPPLK